ncbi:response regulator [Sphingomonas sp. SM33]|uniref:Response regulator n=1 Tax=Sphingomonas telluris TaxID=2907998 RepID=A0ABS9VNH8_9SPHN|nr:response regulator [Sphingomonas telluris]MCH8616531.1 response regulator [Sphingomonas telluris]
MHALIIEDEDLIAIAIEEVLRECGFTSFHFAVSFDEAVAAARERCPQLITADVELRPGSGIDAVQTICTDNPIPVIFITGRVDAARSRMPQHPVMSKPFRISDVESAVRQIMSQQ